MHLPQKLEAENHQRRKEVVEKAAKFSLPPPKQFGENEKFNQKELKFFEGQPVEKQLSEQVEKGVEEHIQHKAEGGGFELHDTEEQEQGDRRKPVFEEEKISLQLYVLIFVISTLSTYFIF